MSKKNRGNQKSRAAVPTHPSKRTSAATVGIVLVAVAIAGLGVWWLRANNAKASRATIVSGQAVAATQPVAGDKPDFGKLKGKWQRPDGGYVVEVRGVADDGKIDAAYYNPNPINVARAAASYEASQMKVYVELQDKGYPGNYYILRYDAGNDQLAGVYYHLGINQQFDVVFLRMK